MSRALAATIAASALLAAPARGQTPQQPQTPRVEVIAPIDERNANEVRQRLNELLREYPPTLAQVLRLDPSLLTREGYLDPYPGLKAFIAQHPDIVRHPSFYLGAPDNRRDDDPRIFAVRAFSDVMSYITALGGFLGLFLLVGWISRLIVEHRRWLRATKTQTEVHAKLFDRLTSNEELLAYVQSPAGQHFLQSAPVAVDASPRPIGAPVSRILWSVQAGVVLAVVGAGLGLVRNLLIDELVGPVAVIAVLITALGIGFALSAGIAYLLSLRLGLLEPRKP
jgi:hypothetical protein